MTNMPPYGQYTVPTVDKCVNFKIGQPSPKMLPLELIRKASEAKFAETDPNFLQYGNIYGFPKFRASLAKFLTKKLNTKVPESQLLATNGNTGALSLIISIFFQSGDLVFAGDPTYFLAKSIFKDFKLECHQIEMEDDGLNIDVLRAELQRRKDQNLKLPKALYIVPTAHNPTGRTLTDAKRKQLVEIAKTYGFYILADEVYQLLTFPHILPPPPMCSYDPDGTTVLAMGSFSKILCPAIRVGWIQSGEAILKQIASCGMLDSSGGLNPISFGIVQKCIDLGYMDKHVEEVRATLYTRYRALEKPLEEAVKEVPGMSFEIPQGGYFVLVKLPEGVDAAQVLPIATKNKVIFLPGGGFSSRMKNFLRLSFSMYEEVDIQVGVDRLVKSVKEYLAK